MAIVFSIILPTYNRPQALQEALQAMAELDYSRACFEVIVVDDGSSMSLEEIVAPFRRSLNLTFKSQANGGPAAARNVGASLAKGEYVAFTDDDCTPASDWLHALETRLAASPDHIIGGRTVNTLITDRYAVASQQLLDYLYEDHGAERSQPRFFASNNMALRADRLIEMGGFSTDFCRPGGEDRELCDRWQHAGNGLTFAPEAIVYHAHAMTAREFWRQHFNYGCGAYYFHQARALRAGQQIKVEPWLFYWRLFRYPFTQAPVLQALAASALLVVAQGANAVGFFWEMSKRRSHGANGRAG